MKWWLITVVVSPAHTLRVKPNQVLPAPAPLKVVVSTENLDKKRFSEIEAAGTATTYLTQVANENENGACENVSGNELVESYPMLCLHVNNLLKYDKLPSHQQVIRDNLLVSYEERLHKGKVLFVSSTYTFFKPTLFSKFQNE